MNKSIQQYHSELFHVCKSQAEYKKSDTLNEHSAKLEQYLEFIETQAMSGEHRIKIQNPDNDSRKLITKMLRKMGFCAHCESAFIEVIIRNPKKVKALKAANIALLVIDAFALVFVPFFVFRLFYSVVALALHFIITLEIIYPSNRNLS